MSEGGPPEEQAATIDALARTWQATLELCTPLRAPEWDRPTALAGWSVKDVVAHLVGFESELAGRAPTTHVASDAPWVRNEIGRRMEHEVDVRRARSGPEVLDELREVTELRLAQLRAYGPQDWSRPNASPAGPGTMYDALQIRVLDCWIHEQDLRRALDRPGHLDGPVAERVVERLWGTLGFVVARRAAAPDGSRVAVELTGPVRRAAVVVVDGGRGRLEPPGGPSTAGIALDSEAFVLLAAGRRPPEELLAAGRVAIDGDDALARAVLTGLNTTP